MSPPRSGVGPPGRAGPGPGRRAAGCMGEPDFCSVRGGAAETVPQTLVPSLVYGKVTCLSLRQAGWLVGWLLHYEYAFGATPQAGRSEAGQLVDKVRSSADK